MIGGNAVQKRTDFFAPSKTLIDAKEKLGPLYYNAKLLECPQNAVELTKLLQEWEDLDKLKHKTVSESKREQRKLLLALNKRHKGSMSSPSIDKFHTEEDVKMPPPGFRFHTNGEPKASSVTEFATPGPASSISRQSTPLEDSLSNMTIHSTKSGDSLEEMFLRDLGKIDYERQIKSLENVVHEIEEELSMVSGTGGRYLRAHSKSDVKKIHLPTDAFSPYPRQPNDRFAFQPGSSLSLEQKRKHHKPAMNVPNQAKCIACQFKLKHSSDDFRKLKESLGKPMVRRWQIAPKGKYAESTQSMTQSQLAGSGSKIKTGQSKTCGVDVNPCPDDHDQEGEQLLQNEVFRTDLSSSSLSRQEHKPVIRFAKSVTDRKPSSSYSSMAYRGGSSNLLHRERQCASTQSFIFKHDMTQYKQQLETDKQNCAKKIGSFYESLKDLSSRA